LEPFGLPLQVDLCLGLVRSESQAAGLSDAYEPLLTAADSITVSELVEDELILALPFAPRHPDAACAAAGQDVAPAKRDKPHPFAVLSTLLQDSKKRE
ncbi:MAG: YceD family protein, partial [Pseudomonadota bacterium]|nr:YceD family protein [Pseudomonadota bacterium]